MILSHQAFTKDTYDSSKRRLEAQKDYLAEVENVYKGVRWLIDVINNTRDKTVQCGPNIYQLKSMLDSIIVTGKISQKTLTRRGPDSY